jgi:hypothetical protein
MLVEEKFTVYVKNSVASDKNRKFNILALDHYLAHKYGIDRTNQIKEEIVSIKDSKGNEVYNINAGFLFDE